MSGEQAVISARVLADVERERLDQGETWADDCNSAVEWVAIAAKQVGQAAHLGLGLGKRDAEFIAGLRHEFVQLAAVAIAAVECIDAGNLVLPE
jgi:hypothetical protein